MVIKILSVFGWLLLALLILLLWVIIMPRHFWIEYSKPDGPIIKMNIGPFKLTLYPLPAFLKKKPKAEKQEKPKEEKPQKEQKSEKTKKDSPLNDVQLSFDLVKQVVAAAKGIVKKIFRAIKFRDVSFTIPVHNKDVEKTQQMYGAVTNSFYTLAIFLQKHLQITFKSPIFIADFADTYKDSIYFYMQVTASPVLLLVAGLYAFTQYQKIMENNKKAPDATEKENNNG